MSTIESDSGRLARNAGWSVVGFAVPSAVMLVAVPVYIGFLGLRDYGLFAIATSLLGLASVLNLGLGQATTKFVAEYAQRGEGGALRPMVYASLLFYLVAGVVGWLGLHLASDLLAERVFDLEGAEAARAARVLEIAALGFIPHVAFTVAQGLFNGLQQYRASQLLAIARSAGTLALGVTALVVGTGLEGLVASMVAVLWLTCGAGFAIGLRRLPPRDRGLRGGGKLLRRVAGFSFYTSLTSIGSVMIGQLDRILLGSLLGLEAVSVYSVAQAAASKLNVLNAAISRVLMPFFSARSVDPDTSGRMAEALLSSWRVSLVIGAALSAVLLAVCPWALKLWLADDFAAMTLPVFAVFVVSYGLNTANIVPYFYLLGRGRPSDITWPTLVGGALMLGGIAALAPVAGVLAAALASLSMPLIWAHMARAAIRITEGYDRGAGISAGALGFVAVHALAALAGFVAGIELERATGSAVVALGGAGVTSAAIAAVAAIVGRRRGNPLFVAFFSIARRVWSRS